MVKNIEIIRIIHFSFTIIINLSHYIKISFDIASIWIEIENGNIDCIINKK